MTCSVKERQGWVESDHPLLSVRQQCLVLGIHRSNLYYKPSAKVLSDEKLDLLRLVDEVYTRYPFFGTRQMKDYITRHHYACKRHRTRWAYEHLGLHSIAPGPHTSKPCIQHEIYPYLLSNVAIVRPCQVFSTDITYIRLKRGFLYLIAIMDWYSRFVLDWQLSVTMEADFCIETLERVLSKTRCDIFNTDQGSQFTSRGFTGVLKSYGVTISMDGKGRWADNIFVERLWRSVKYECIYLQEWESVARVKVALKEYFQFYNHERPHQSLNGFTPAHMHGIMH